MRKTTTFSISATQDQLEQLEELEKDLRWSKSKLIRMAIDLLLETHRKYPKRYGL